MPDEIGTKCPGFSGIQRQDSPFPWSVYTATETNTGRSVRLSVLWAPQHMSAERRRSVLDWFAEAGFQEQRLASAFVPIVVAYHSDEDAAWIAADRPRGRLLRTVIEDEGPFPAERAMLISGRIAAALAPAHAAGWAHGWLNADTVWLGEGDEVAVTDLGLGLAVSPVTNGLQQPFAARSGLLSSDPRRQDLQSLGLLTTWMLAGRLPDPVGIPRADAFPKSVPPNVVKAARSLVDPQSEDYLTAVEWRTFAGVDGASATTEAGSPFYETSDGGGWSLPRWLLPSLALIAVVALVWLAGRFWPVSPQLGPSGALQDVPAAASGEKDTWTAVQVGPVSPEDEQEVTDRLIGLGEPVFVKREGDQVYIQVAALANAEGARQEKLKLEAAGFRVRLQEVEPTPRQ